MTVQPAPAAVRRHTAPILLRSLVAAGLVTDAVVHLHLASSYQEASPGGIGVGTLFRLEAVVALGATLYVLVRGTRRAYAVACLVAFTALLAVLASRYVNLPAIGPLPAMYEPVWFLEKVVSAVGEGLAGAVAAMAFTRRPAAETPPS
jgi:hypothetical protein